MSKLDEEPKDVELANVPKLDGEVAPGTESNLEAGQPIEPPTKPWRQALKFGLGLFVPVFLETLDQTVVATAQTRIASQFNQLSEQQWIGTSYLLTATVFLPVFGALADVIGRYWALQLATTFFIVGSAICTGAQSLVPLLIGRAVSGIGAGGLTTIARIILSDSSNLKQNQAQAIIMTLLYAVGYSVGPIIGGALASTNWRWCFAINLPACVVALAAAFLMLRHYRNPVIFPVGTPLSAKLLTLDYLGSVLFVTGGILIILALSWGGQEAWNEPKVIAVFVVGGVLWIVFQLWQWKLDRVAPSARRGLLAARPLIPIHNFKDLDVIATSLLGFGSGIMMFGMFYFLSTYFILVQGLSQTNTGAVLLAFMPGLGVGVNLTRLVINKTKNAKYVSIFGGVLGAVAVGVLSQGIADGNIILIYVFTGFVGASTGITMLSSALQLRFTRTREEVATVTALNMFFRTFGGVVGLAQMGAVLNTRARNYIIAAVYSGTLTPEEVQLTVAALSSANSIASLPPAVLEVARAALATGLRWCFISIIPWLAIAAISTVFMTSKLTFEEPQ